MLQSPLFFKSLKRALVKLRILQKRNQRGLPCRLYEFFHSKPQDLFLFPKATGKESVVSIQKYFMFY
jgi:hypothetical protein